MACAGVDPRMLDLVWTDRLEYEALLYKRPVCTHAEPTSTPSPAAPPKKKEAAKPATNTAPPAKKKEAVKSAPTSSVAADSKGLLADLEAARGFIRASLGQAAKVTSVDSLNERATQLETSNSALRKLVEELTAQIERLEAKAKARVGGAPAAPAAAAVTAAPEPAKPAQPPKKQDDDDDDDDDDDFDFGDSDEEEEPKGETEMQRMKREAAEKKAAEAAAKKSKKPAPVLKSNVVLDVKPWDDETDLGELEKSVRGITMEGLLWGDSKLVDIGFGIKKLRISTCIVDDLVGLYDLEDKIQELEDYVQSCDIVSHNKI